MMFAKNPLFDTEFVTPSTSDKIFIVILIRRFNNDLPSSVFSIFNPLTTIVILKKKLAGFTPAARLQNYISDIIAQQAMRKNFFSPIFSTILQNRVRA